MTQTRYNPRTRTPRTTCRHCGELVDYIAPQCRTRWVHWEFVDLGHHAEECPDDDEQYAEPVER